MVHSTFYTKNQNKKYDFPRVLPSSWIPGIFTITSRTDGMGGYGENDHLRMSRESKVTFTGKKSLRNRLRRSNTL